MESNHMEDFQWGKKNELLWIGFSILVAGLIAKIPQFQGEREDLFYQKYISFIFFPILMIYFNWKNNQSWIKLIVPAIAIVIAVLYINWLPASFALLSNDLIIVHLPILVWILVGYVFIGSSVANFKKGIAYLRFTGDIAIMSLVILIAGFLFMAMTMGLFKLIGIETNNIIQFYVLVWGLPSIPIISTYIVQNNPQVVNKISPIIAKMFTPIVTLMLILFVFGIIFTGKNPSKDREFLLVFNALLIGVMALIIFSLSEMTKKGKHTFQLYTLLLLSSITILINCVALYAIIFRLVEFGLSANRVAVIGADVLIFIHLFLVTRKLLLFQKSSVSVHEVEEIVGIFLPVYFCWAVFIVFVLPLIFGNFAP